MKLDEVEADPMALLPDLKRDGAVVLPQLYAHLAPALLAEHRRAFAGALPMEHMTILDGECIFPLTPRKLQNVGLYELHMVLTNSWFATLAAAYLSRSPAPVEMLSLSWDKEKISPEGAGNHHAHWDPTLSLRMMLYITDVTQTNGALELKRGTHIENHRRRLSEWGQGLPYAEKPICAGSQMPFEIVEATAGSVLVFDVSLSHRRGLLQAGAERCVAFAHLHSYLAQHQLAGAAFDDIAESDLWPHLPI